MWDFCRLTAAVLETVSGWAVCAAIRLRFQVFFSRFRSCQTASSPIISARRGNKTRQLRCTEVGVDAQVKDKNYRPSDREPFMNERQREYFRNKLLAWKEDILKEAQETLQHLQDENQNHPDFADRASAETERAIELRARDRQRKLIGKIDAALQRIDDGTYGYCEETGEPISLRRLEARPIATLSITAQEGHEQRERVYRND